MRLLFLLLFSTGLLFPAEPSVRSWRGWDDYHVIMWSTGSPASQVKWYERLRELGFDGEQCTRGNNSAPMVQNGMGFYVENLIPELGFLSTARQNIYKADYDGYTSTRDKANLVRKPCYHDPAFLTNIRPQLQAYIQQYLADKPLLHDLRDELSIGRFANPMDYCFCPHSLKAMREWLQTRYESLDALNAEWETSFGSWDEVTPLTTYEIKTREKTALSAGTAENYAPWSDHREFMEQTWAQTLGALRDVVREIDPDTPVGIEGTQMPSAWGGYDLWQLSKNIDWVEPYDIGTSREIFRSFLPPKTPILSTMFGADANPLKRELWRLLLNGDRGTIVWDDDDSGGRAITKTVAEMPVTDRGRILQAIFGEIKPLAPRIMALTRKDDRIAIHYSQASLRAHWMFDSREDGNTWPKRFSSYEASHSRISRTRDGMVRLVEDLGLQYTFVSYEQITAGELIAGGYKVLLMPQSVAVSAEAAGGRQSGYAVRHRARQGGLDRISRGREARRGGGCGAVARLRERVEGGGGRGAAIGCGRAGDCPACRGCGADGLPEPGCARLRKTAADSAEGAGAAGRVPGVAEEFGRRGSGAGAGCRKRYSGAGRAGVAVQQRGPGVSGGDAQSGTGCGFVFRFRLSFERGTGATAGGGDPAGGCPAGSQFPDGG
ncbi:MAG: beta-galactosidase [Acidobacteria bacterium]|nr:beta-galactosidase [Acidobacteriota bacterium]